MDGGGVDGKARQTEREVSACYTNKQPDLVGVRR